MRWGTCREDPELHLLLQRQRPFALLPLLLLLPLTLVLFLLLSQALFLVGHQGLFF